MRTGLWIIATLAIHGCSHTSRENSTKNTGSTPKIEQARWLIGTWYNETPKATIYEVWKQLNDTTFVGVSYSVHGADTSLSESIRLVQDGNDLTYIPTVPGQNMGQAVSFELTFIDKNKMVFENAEHDFPKMITYDHVSTDSLVAEVSGVVEGKVRASKFHMQRVN